MVWSGPQGNGLDALYRAALVAPHVVYNRVDITDYQGNVLISDLPLLSGSVTATLANRVARTLSLTTQRSYFPVTSAGAPDTSAALAPFGNRVKAYRGITYGDGSTCYFPVFTGRLDKVALNHAGVVSVTASDLAAEVVEANFEAPTSADPTLAITDQFTALIRGAVVGATFGTSDTYAALTPALHWQNDRGRACDDLAAAVGGIWYPLADGSFVLRQVPWTKAGQASVVTLADGQGGLITGSSWSWAMSRAGVNSSIVYTVNRLTGEAPIDVTVRDDTVTSPTYWKGGFGLKPRLVQAQASIDAGQAYAAASTLLKSAKALSVNFENATIIPDPSLELGDVVLCTADGVSDLQVITGFTLPLLADQGMSLTLRAYTPS